MHPVLDRAGAVGLGDADVEALALELAHEAEARAPMATRSVQVTR